MITEDVKTQSEYKGKKLIDILRKRFVSAEILVLIYTTPGRGDNVWVIMFI